MGAYEQLEKNRNPDISGCAESVCPAQRQRLEDTHALRRTISGRENFTTVSGDSYDKDSKAVKGFDSESVMSINEIS